MIGPNCPGVLSPGKANAGIIPAEIFTEGSVGLVSRSGTLTYQIGHELTQLGLGNSTIVGIGGDPVVGSSFIDVVAKFEADPRDRAHRPRRRDRRRRGGEGGGVHRRARHEAGARVHRGLLGTARQDDGPRGRDHLRLLGHGRREEGGARGERHRGRHDADRGRAVVAVRRLKWTPSGPFARGVPRARSRALQRVDEFGRLRARRARARRQARPPVRARRRLRPAAGRDRGAPRRRAGPHPRDERLAAGLRLSRPAARQAGRARPRRGADLRPSAEDPLRVSAPRSSTCRWTTTGSIPTRSSGPDRRIRIPLHDPDVPEPERPDDVGGAPRTPRRARRACAACSCSRTIRTASCATKATAAERVRALRRRDRVLLLFLEDRRARAPRGLVRAPAELAAELEALATSTYISPPFLSQATVLEFLTRGSFAPNLERVNGLLRDRRDAMLAALEREMPDDATWTRPDGGYFVWLDLPSGPPSAELLVRAEEQGVSFVKGSDFFPGATAALDHCASPSASSHRRKSRTASSCSRSFSKRPGRRCAVRAAAAAAARDCPSTPPGTSGRWLLRPRHRGRRGRSSSHYRWVWNACS